MAAITKETVKSKIFQCLHDRTNSNLNGCLVTTKSYLTLKKMALTGTAIKSTLSSAPANDDCFHQNLLWQIT